MKANNTFRFNTSRTFLLGLLGMLVLVTLSAPQPVGAQDNPELTLTFSVVLSHTEVKPNSQVDLMIEVTNTGNVSVEQYPVLLHSTIGLVLAENKTPHDLYEPVLTKTISLLPGASEKMVVPMYVLADAAPTEAIALIHPQGEGRSNKTVARLEIPVIGGIPRLMPLADYKMPDPPGVSCGDAPSLSTVGNTAKDAIKSGDFSQYTRCNKFEGDWILDVPNVTPGTTATTAEDFYTMIGDLIRNTQYTFSLSTLGFYTHSQEDEFNLVKKYLAPAIRDLNQKLKDNPTPGRERPLLRFAYSDSNKVPLTAFPDHDDVNEVYDDLTYELRQEESDPKKWQVSIAVATIGQIDTGSISLGVTSPFNHSKIAVRDYRHAIVGGMNWDLNYVQSTDVNGNSDYTDDTAPRLHDLSIKVEGEAAKASGLYFDKLWRRNIDEIFDFSYSGECKTSWQRYDWKGDGQNDNCSLDAVPNYAPDNKMPAYSMNTQHNVFGLGRGHKEWRTTAIKHDTSADEAVLVAFDVAEDSIYINQHQLTNPSLTGFPYNVKDIRDRFTPEVKVALLHAIVDRGVRVKIIMSEPWGTEGADAAKAVYESLDDALHGQFLFNSIWYHKRYTTEYIYNAHCRLEFAPFRSPKSTDPKDYTHNKFFMIDDKAFFVGSQNLYPSAIGQAAKKEWLMPQLNEYGFLIDDAGLAAVMKRDYWDPVWNASRTPEVAKEFRSKSAYLPEDWDCSKQFPLDVMKPTKINPAYAGPHNNPQKIVIQVTKQINGKPQSDFEVKIGGIVAKIVTFYEAPDSYFLEVVPPNQTANGLYDVTVTTTGGNTATETQAVSYADTNNVDVMLVLDHSGSMEVDDNMGKAKEAAKLFVDYMYDNDQVGVASFSTFADLDYPLTPVTAGSRLQAKNAIDTLSPFEATTIGGGLQEGQEELLRHGQATHPWAIVLLSDGVENTFPYVADVLPDIQGTKTVVHTIALGEGADQAQMLEIASQTGGTYHYIPGIISNDVQLQLADIYNAIAGTVTGKQTIFTINGLLRLLKEVEKSVTIDATLGEATFSTSWLRPTSNIKMVLQAPDGTIIDSTTASSNPNMVYVSGKTYAYYRIKRPMLKDGDWKMKLTWESTTSARSDVVATAADEEPYAIQVDGQIVGTAITLRTYLDKTNYITNTPIKVSTTLSDDKPILGAEVTAIVGPLVTALQPSQDMANEPILRLYDDGAHGDGAANDGVYANLLMARNTLKADSYSFQVFAMGKASNGQTFARRTQQSVNIGITSSVNPTSVTAMAERTSNRVYLPLVTK